VDKILTALNTEGIRGRGREGERGRKMKKEEVRNNGILISLVGLDSSCPWVYRIGN